MTGPLAAWPAILMGLLCFAGPAQAQSGVEGWSDYRNEKFGFSLRYPSHRFDVERTAEAGDGQVFISKQGDARLLVGALVNETGFTPATYQEHVAKQSYGNFRIEYRPRGQSWFVLSGEGDGRIFYEKVMFSCSGRLISSFAMIYPADRRHVFDPIVERIEDSFRPGVACERASAALPEGRAEQAAPEKALRPKQARRRDASRSHSQRARGRHGQLADGLARERGRDVYVILQRTTPPYDRKVVRGYASGR